MVWTIWLFRYIVKEAAEPSPQHDLVVKVPPTTVLPHVIWNNREKTCASHQKPVVVQHVQAMVLPLLVIEYHEGQRLISAAQYRGTRSRDGENAAQHSHHEGDQGFVSSVGVVENESVRMSAQMAAQANAQKKDFPESEGDHHSCL